ncbi:MAG: DNA-binding protein WhiA [Ruminococcus sp.]|nr:DNA-binding protein WhiA [Ruminococcus sp.]
MSFSNDVRKEICSSVNDKDKRFACLYGMLLFSRTLTREHICFQSESSISAGLFGELFRSVFHVELSCRENVRRNDMVLYCYDITDTELIGKVFVKYHFDEMQRKLDSEIIATNSLGVFTAGVFLACGSVNDPAKEYHLEFSALIAELADDLVMLLGDIGVSAGKVVRRGQYIVYIKDSESIEDTLTFIGAQQCTLELMNVKIYKDVRNKANRIRNCDAANIDKVLNAAIKQRNDIKLIASVIGLDSLSDELREVAELRLENSDMSLQEIGDSLTVPISRSGVNHRFKKLSRIAEELRSGGAKNEK